LAKRLLEPDPQTTPMSDTEEITRKIPGGSKIIEKVEKTVEDDGEPNGKQVERAVKRRKIDEIPAEYEYCS
jgi:chemotaxis receptor (MCP) glutamine deamidase CheD